MERISGITAATRHSALATSHSSELRVVTFLGRAKRTLHQQVVVEQGKENRDAVRVSSFPKSRHSRESGNPTNQGPRFRGDDDLLVLDGKPVIRIPAFDGVENLALHRIGGVR